MIFRQERDLMQKKNLYFNPGCALQIYSPKSVQKIFRYLKSNYPQIRMHDICCRHDPRLPEGSCIINVCAGCDHRFRTLYPGISTVSLWETIAELDNFPFPDYNGMEISIHDACPVRNTPAVHEAVRTLLKKMNFRIVEAAHHGTNSVCCGDSLYPDCDMEAVLAAMHRRAESMPCENVAVYCVSCVKAMSVGGRIPRYMVDLLLGQPTVPQECDIREWHDELNRYIDAH
jgi:hypothetical protein